MGEPFILDAWTYPASPYLPHHELDSISLPASDAEVDRYISDYGRLSSVRLSVMSPRDWVQDMFLPSDGISLDSLQDINLLARCYGYAETISDPDAACCVAWGADEPTYLEACNILLQLDKAEYCPFASAGLEDSYANMGEMYLHKVLSEGPRRFIEETSLGDLGYLDSFIDYEKLGTAFMEEEHHYYCDKGYLLSGGDLIDRHAYDREDIAAFLDDFEHQISEPDRDSEAR